MSKEEKKEIEESKELSVIEKVELMNSLVHVIKDKEFIELLKSKENGELVYEVFKKAATDTIEELMGNKSGKKEDIQTVSSVAKELKSTMDFFMNSELINVLAMLNNNISNPQSSQARQMINKQPKETKQQSHRTNGIDRNSTGLY